jgi:RNA polymerase sigma factor (sigma-70 family)
VDHGDFAAAVDRHYPALVQRLTLVLHDAEEAKDVAQDAYLRAFQAWDRFDGTDARAWLHTIGLRLAFNRLRRRRLWDRWLRGQRSEPTWVVPERLDLWYGLADLRPQQRRAAPQRPRWLHPGGDRPHVRRAGGHGGRLDRRCEATHAPNPRG